MTIGWLLHDLFNSYIMGMSGLPDIYTRSLRAAGLRAEGVYIRRTMSAHGITAICHFVLIVRGRALSSSSPLNGFIIFIVYSSTY